MQKYLSVLALFLVCSAGALAQSGSATDVPQRDPNPPYGAAAGANVNRAAILPAGASPATGSNQQSTGSNAATTSPAPDSARCATGTPNAAGSSGNAGSSGASTVRGATQTAPAERPGAAIASRGSTTAGNTGAAPYDPGSTPGWSMMTPQEQQNYSGRMNSFTSVAQCRAYQAAYLAQIQERARRMGQIVQSEGTDPCATLQQQGSLK